eukprot:GHVL01013723.1.p1 GENE.GHVL01013723.1~~GHVL01013723.1.p1  ORF type:complete len:313 (+),score=31.29 GHVL01013723.1:668-1606(+)
MYFIIVKSKLRFTNVLKHFLLKIFNHLNLLIDTCFSLIFKWVLIYDTHKSSLYIPELNTSLLDGVAHALLASLDYIYFPDELPLWVVVHQVDALALLAVVEALLGNVQRVLRLLQGLLHDALGLVQGVDLADHVVRLVVQLRLPEGDVADALAQALAHVGLRALGLVVRLAAHADRVQAETLSPGADSIGGQVVALVGRGPVVGGEAGVQGVAGGGEHRGDLESIELVESRPARHGVWHGAGEGRAGVDLGRLVVGAGPPGQGGQGPPHGGGGGVGVEGLEGGVHGADGRQVEGLAGVHAGPRHVGGGLRVT